MIICQGGIVYVGLDVLFDFVVVGVVGNFMFVDFVLVGGKFYKIGIDLYCLDGKVILLIICCYFDEVNEICGFEFVFMVNKFGGVGFCIMVYIQFIVDFEVKIGLIVKVNQILDNFNYVVMFWVWLINIVNLIVE